MDARSLVSLIVIYSVFVRLSTVPTTASSEYASASLSRILVSAGLPAGLFPKNAVKSFDLDDAGRLKVYLDRPCLAKYETRVFFDKVVKANLSRGAMTGVEGLAQEELFLWLPIRDIYVTNPASGLILFDIGVAHKEMALSIFEEPRACSPTQGVDKVVNAEGENLQIYENRNICRSVDNIDVDVIFADF